MPAPELEALGSAKMLNGSFERDDSVGRPDGAGRSREGRGRLVDGCRGMAWGMASGTGRELLDWEAKGEGAGAAETIALGLMERFSYEVY